MCATSFVYHIPCVLCRVCISEKRRDLKVSSLKLLPGGAVNQAEWVKFEMSIAVDGEDIPAMEAAPTVAPFDIAFYLSDDDMLSDDDIDLGYSLSWGASEVLKSGLEGGKTHIVQDLKGNFLLLTLTWETCVTQPLTPS